MNVAFEIIKATEYTSQSQRIRVLTESWTGTNIYCPRCGNGTITHFPNNRAVADFYCPNCNNEYELKSMKGQVHGKIPDGAYDSFVSRITSNNNPDFFLLNYDAKDLCVNNFWLIPKHFFTPNVIERRNPLSQNARRAGWVGCNILLDAIPQQGRICLIRDRVPVEKEIVLANVERASMLQRNHLDERGWLLDVLNCVNSIPNVHFCLEEVYSFEKTLKSRHPSNNNIRAKIRQQLQKLRDSGFIQFLGKGQYKKLF